MKKLILFLFIVQFFVSCAKEKKYEWDGCRCSNGNTYGLPKYGTYEEAKQYCLDWGVMQTDCSSPEPIKK